MFYEVTVTIILNMPYIYIYIYIYINVVFLLRFEIFFLFLTYFISRTEKNSKIMSSTLKIYLTWRKSAEFTTSKITLKKTTAKVRWEIVPFYKLWTLNFSSFIYIILYIIIILINHPKIKQRLIKHQLLPSQKKPYQLIWATFHLEIITTTKTLINLH